MTLQADGHEGRDFEVSDVYKNSDEICATQQWVVGSNPLKSLVKLASATHVAAVETLPVKPRL